jgi:hypothetical protein
VHAEHPLNSLWFRFEQEADYDGRMATALIETFYPILVSKTDESVTEEELEVFFRRFAELADQAIRSGTRHVVIVLNDPSKFTPAARKRVAEAQARHVTPARNDVTLAAFVPIDSALARGALTAIRWVSPDLVKHVRFVPTTEAALRAALAVLEEQGTPFTGDEKALRVALGLSVGAVHHKD